ncbi:MAG: GNAT family N-acetyltransferase [Gammaproteobacteria bacterium]|nr:GNAT family N-acetyltransferase [Gammaproteobacteria bacterium]
MNFEIRTDRLALIPLELSDRDILIELFTNEDVVEYAGEIMSDDQILRKLPQWIRRGGNGCLGVWCVTERATGEKLGTGALLPMPIEEDDTDWDLIVPGSMPNNDIEVGFFLKPSAWGKGFATEICTALLRLAFDRSPLNEVFATYDFENAASQNVLLKCGFVRHGTRRCYGEDGPDVRISREQWQLT